MKNQFELKEVILSEIGVPFTFEPKELNSKITERGRIVERFIGENSEMEFIAYYCEKILIAFIVKKNELERYRIGVTRNKGNKLYWVKLLFNDRGKDKSMIWSYTTKRMAIFNLESKIYYILKEELPAHQETKDFLKKWLLEYKEGRV